MADALFTCSIIVHEFKDFCVRLYMTVEDRVVVSSNVWVNVVLLCILSTDFLHLNH